MKITILNAIFIFCFCYWRVTALPDHITIGGIFDEHDQRQHLAFKYAVERVNHQRLLPRSQLHAHIERLPEDDSFHASKRVCLLLRRGVAAIFGPQSENMANHVQSICDAKEIPFIETRWDYKSSRDEYSINLYPYSFSLSQAYRDILSELQWNKFVILYDSNEGLVRLQSLLQEKAFSITVRHLDDPDGDYRPLLKEVKTTMNRRIVLDVAQDRIYSVLQQATQIGMMTEYYSYFITSLDFSLIDLEAFRYSGTNITGIQLINQNKNVLKSVVETWKYGESKYGRNLRDEFLQVTTEAALMYDAVHLFAIALQQLDETSDEVEIRELNCEGDQTWQHGSSLINYMKWYGSRQYPGTSRRPMAGSLWSNRTAYSNMEPFQATGLTGLIKFNTLGFREDFQLNILEIDQQETLKSTGTWTLEKGAKFTRTWTEVSDKVETSLNNKTLIVSTAITPPYSMYTEKSDEQKGNNRYEGFCIDLIDEIAKLKGFNYSFHEVADKSYGSRDRKTGEWNGIVRELLDNKADLGIVDFTITYEREEAIDFSMPFMNLGISIIYKKPQKKPPNLFSFTSPFSGDVWIYMATAYLGVSVLLFILARAVPDEWDNPYPCIEEPEELENCFTLINSLWFIIATFLCQGADIAPRAVSTRIVAGIWWFFTLIMISSYTANLAAFLTVERMDSPIEGAEDLAKQTKIKYGCKNGGSTFNFFRDSKIPTYQRMWSAMQQARPTVFTESNKDGVEKVSRSNGQYAFLMESSSIEYEVERRCDLTQIGGLLDSKSYGIALPPGSPYTGHISSAILQLKENGQLHRLKTKWWKQQKGGGRCLPDENKDAASSAELGIQNVGGVFVVMVGGSVAAIFIACCEFSWKARKLATEEGASFGEELRKELLFIVNCRESEKPVRKKSSPAETDTSSIYDESSSYGYSDKK